MTQDRFQIQILPDSLYILRRDHDGWEASFPSIKQALDYAESLPGGKDAQMTVFEAQGVRFAKIVS